MKETYGACDVIHTSLATDRPTLTVRVQPAGCFACGSRVLRLRSEPAKRARRTRSHPGSAHSPVHRDYYIHPANGPGSNANNGTSSAVWRRPRLRRGQGCQGAGGGTVFTGGGGRERGWDRGAERGGGGSVRREPCIQHCERGLPTAYWHTATCKQPCVQLIKFKTFRNNIGDLKHLMTHVFRSPAGSPPCGIP